jgi:hypothetical protein
MRYRWLRRLAVSLSIVLIGHFGMSSPLALGAEPTSNIQPYLPLPAPAGGAEESEEPTPAATLERPVALTEERNEVDRHIQPTGLFSGPAGKTVVLSPSVNYAVARPMPPGIEDGTPLPVPTPILTSPPPPDLPTTWRQSPLISAPAISSSTTLVPSPTASTMPGSAVPGIVASPGVVAGPGVVANGPVASTVIDGGCMGDGVCGDVCGDPCCGGWGDACGGCGNGCCFGNRWYGSAEYLLWFIRGQNLPPLLTSGSVLGNPPGALGQPGTTVLFGGNSFDNNPYSGLRLRGGYWFNDCHTWGLDLGGFFLGTGVNSFSSSSSGLPFLARPFVNALTGAQDIEAVATPNGLAGTFSAVNGFVLFGAEANLRRNFLCGCNWFVDGFAGWRTVGLNESLGLRENLGIVSSSNPNLPAGTTFVVNDRFATSNLFNGAQIGGIGEYRIGRWSFDVRGSVALGGTEQFVSISGSTFSAAPGIPGSTAPGGLLAQSSNMGRYTRGMVSMVDEIGFNVGYQFTNHIRGFVGYNFLYWTSVVRPGNQIDPVVNPNLIPPATAGGPARPAFSFNGSDFWVQGIQFGLDIRW